MISSQYGTVFTKSSYEKIKKVYSIWICTKVPPEMRGAILKYELKELVLRGTVGLPQADYDLMTPVIVCLGENNTIAEQRSALIDMLNGLMLDDESSYQQKCQRLIDDFGVEMTPQLERGVADMCNLSQGVFERGELKMKIEIALEMIKEKMNIDVIARLTKLSAAEVRKLAADNGLSVV